jgi:hypothetical protein
MVGVGVRGVDESNVFKTRLGGGPAPGGRQTTVLR